MLVVVFQEMAVFWYSETAICIAVKLEEAYFRLNRDNQKQRKKITDASLYEVFQGLYGGWRMGAEEKDVAYPNVTHCGREAWL
jgi:hypothetical protein